MKTNKNRMKEAADELEAELNPLSIAF